MKPQQNCPGCDKPTTKTNLKRSYLGLCQRCHILRTRSPEAVAAFLAAFPPAPVAP